MVVVTDLGFAKRARTFAELLEAPLAIIEKRRHGNLDRAEVMNVIGDVRGKRAIIVDDEIDTAGTLIEIVRALEREGVDRDLRLRHPRRPVRPGDRPDRDSSLREVVITDTVPLPGRQADRRRSRCCRWRRSSARRSSASTAASRSAPCSAREVSFTQEMLLWEDGADGDADGPTAPRPR